VFVFILCYLLSHKEGQVLVFILFKVAETHDSDQTASNWAALSPLPRRCHGMLCWATMTMGMA
jgi:hypothetical protein